MHRTQAETRPTAIIVIAMVELTLTTAFIHLTLGGLLFTLNAIGYVMLAAAMVVIATVPHSLVRRFDWVPRFGLAAYTLATIGGYVVMGPYFNLGWVAKAIEVAILTLLVADVMGAYGSPSELIRAARRSIGLDREARPVRPA